MSADKPTSLCLEVEEPVALHVDSMPSNTIGKDETLPKSGSTPNSLLKDERRIVRRIDTFVMPILVITFMIQYTDKVILNGASQFGIVQDLHLYRPVGFDPKTNEPVLDLKRYSNATLIFYWGCLAGLLPASFLAQKLPIGKFMGASVIIWGAVVMLTLTTTSYEGFLAQRFFLGVSECAVAPGFSIIIAMWWKRVEQPLRFSVWYTSTGFGGFFGSLLIFGIGHIKGSLAPWRYQYLILGALTVVWGFLVFCFLPDHPNSAWFLSEEDKITAIERMRGEQTGIENKKFKLSQVKETLFDPKTWIMFLTTFAIHFVNGAVSGFGAIIVRSFGYSHLKSILLIGCVGIVASATLLLAGFATLYLTQARTMIMAACQVPVIIGSALVWKMDWITNRSAALSGFLLLGTFAASYMMMLALSAANTAGHTKKVFTSGLLWCAWGISNGVAPLTIKTTEAHEHFPTCFKATLMAASASILGSCMLHLYLRWRNTVRQRMTSPVDMASASLVGFDDQTDVENRHFRYVL